MDQNNIQQKDFQPIADIQLNDIQQKDIQHNDIQQKDISHNDIQQKDILHNGIRQSDTPELHEAK